MIEIHSANILVREKDYKQEKRYRLCRMMIGKMKDIMQNIYIGDSEGQESSLVFCCSPWGCSVGQD